jgi:predicted phage terminase large subunit-like protein
MKTSVPSKIYGRSLQAFVEKAFRSVSGKRLSNSQLYINFIVWNLEQFLQGDIKKLLVNLPGRHLKTFLCSVCFPAFALGLDPTLKFMIVAYSEELAEDIVRQIREIMESPWYKRVFETRVAEGHSRKNDFTIKGGGRVRAVPVRSVTGRGGDIIIFDDAHNAADWDNARQKEKVIEAFEMLVSRRDGGKLSQMLVVGHRVAEDDLSAHILDRGDFEHVCLPLFAPRKMSFDIGHGTFKFAKGEALRPDAFPPDEIESIRRNHRGPPFWLYYQQGLGPRRDDFQIEVSDFPFLERERLGDLLATGVPVVLSVDPAQKTNSTSRNVIHVYAIRGNYYDFLQAFAEKCSFGRLARKVKYFAERYQASVVIVENTARGPDLIDKLRREMSIPIRPVKPRGSKGDRLRKCAPIIRAKRIRIRQRLAVEEAIDEIVAYPNSPYDDHVDALTNFLSEAPNLDAGDRTRSSVARPEHAGLASASRPAVGQFPISGAAIARGRSIFGPAPLPDFSNGRAQTQPRNGERSPYAAEGSSAPIYGFDGTKMVRLK